MPAQGLAAAVLFDCAVVVPFAWWLVAFRGRPSAGRRTRTVLVASLAAAALVLPSDGRAAVSALRLLALPFELVALVATVRAIAQVLKAARAEADLAERVDEAMTKALGDHAMARLLAAEANALAFALTGGGRTPPPRPGVDFTLDEARSPAMTYGLVLATIVESAVVHAIVGATHPAVAWVLTGLGAYSILWLVGHDRALAARAIVVDADHLVLRAGLRLSARVPWSIVAGADAGSPAALPERSRDALDAARPVDANVMIRFAEPVEVTGAFGVRRSVTRVAVCVDDPSGLRAAVDRRRAAPTTSRTPASARVPSR